MGKRRHAYNIFMGKPDGKRPLGRPRAGGRIMMDLQEVVWGGMDWINLTQDRGKGLRSLSGAFSALQPKADCTLTPK